MKLFTFLLLAWSIVSLRAQGIAGEIIKAGQADAKVFLNAYLQPVFKGFASASNAGWYNSAKPLGKLGFHISLTASAFDVPVKEQYYTFSQLPLQNTRYTYAPAATTTSSYNLPTVFGKGPEITQYYDVFYNIQAGTKDSSVFLCRMKMPEGLNLPLAPAIPPALQLNLGGFKQTELMIRYFPGISIQNFSSTQFGFGIKHSIKQWLPVVKKVPVWDWSCIGGFTHFKHTLSVAQNNRLTAGEYPNAINYLSFKDKAYEDQGYALLGNAFNIGTAASIKIGPLSPYIGLCYTRAWSGFKMQGTYPVLVAEDQITDPHFAKPKIIELQNPVEINGDVDGFRCTAGLRLKLGYFVLHYDYSINTYGYNLHSAGIGLHVQELIPL
jgi:hypothetical protein